MRSRCLLLGLAVLLMLNITASANLMAVWDFGPNAGGYTLTPQYEFVLGIPSIVAGNADYDVDGGNGVAFIDAAGNSHNSGQSLHWNDTSKSGNNAYITLTIDTTGWKDMAIRWDYMSDNTGSNKGPASFDMDYKIGSGSWISIVNDYVITRDDVWHQFSYDFSSLTAINNQPSIQFRVNDFDKNDKNGDYWQDNIQVTGIAIPEPLSAIFLTIGGLATLLTKRRL